MVVHSVSYRYSQHFRVPAKEAFEWCTDYSPGDPALMGIKGTRKFERLAEDTIFITDTTYSKGKAVKKGKVIKLDPERLAYYNFHVSGPYQNSLYLYQIVPDGDGESRLDFTAYEVSYPRKAPTKKEQADAAKAEDASWRREWGNLARAMEKELR